MSEALTALCNNPDYGKAHDTRMQQITKIAEESLLNPVVPSLSRHTMTEFHQRITTQAVNLVKLMQRSTATYETKVPNYGQEDDWTAPIAPTTSTRVALRSSDLSRIDAVDLTSRMAVKPGKRYIEDVNGHIGWQLLPCRPGLYRRLENREDSVLLLRRPKIIVVLHEPIPRAGRQNSVDVRPQQGERKVQ